MSRAAFLPRLLPALVAVLALAALPSAAGPPEELAAPVRGNLGDAVELGEAGLVRLWPAVEVPDGDGAAGLGVAFPSFVPGSFLGVVEVGQGWSDYKGQGIAPGLYVLRYAVEPEDGYHLGVSLYRDFALLVPAAEGGGKEPWDEERLIAAAAGAAGGNHPAVLALWPADGREPGEHFDNDMGQPTVAVVVGEVTVGVVLEGTGEAE